jgi:hypothetical protein
MNKLKKSSTGYERVSTTPTALWTSPYSSLETLKSIRRSEAREWLQRYRRKASQDGAAAAQVWWAGVIADIERIRGLDAAINLRNLMNDERSK